MNKLRTLFTWGLLLAATHVMGYNITVDPIEIETGKSTNLVINLSNTETNLTAYQMKLFLPTGVTVQKGNEGKYQYTPNTARHSGNFSFTVMDAADGSVLITCLSPDKDALLGTSGELLRLPISVASTATVGQTQGNIKEIEFTDQQSQAHRLTDVQFSITLQASSPAITFADANVKALCVAKWDTNGDGELSEAEAKAVKGLGTVFKGNAKIMSFDELRNFTGLTYIDDDFDGCTSLTSVTIPNSVTSIGINAFYECRGLTSVTIPNSVMSIGQTAFYGCSSLTSITIPNNVTSIGLSAFSGCSSLTSIKVENGNTVYDSRNDCNAIIETADNVLICGCNATVIPNSVTSIGWYAFFDCSGLTSIIIPNGVTSIGVGSFYDCTSLTSVTIPNSVTSIGNSAFRNCFGLTSLTIPNSVTSIGDHAFYGCSGLTNMTVEWETPIIINSTVFDNSNQMNATLYVPYGCKTAYEVADYWKEFKEIVEPEPEFKPGDVNGDRSIDVADIASVISIMAAGVGTDPVSVRADVNRDGTVDVADIASVISIMAASARRLDIED